VDYDGEALRQKKLVASRRTETVVEKVEIGPRHDRVYFQRVKIPAGLPVFTIRDEKLVGSSLPEPIGDEATERAKLAEVVARVCDQERRYADLEAKARVTYRHLGSDMFMEGIITEETSEQRSVLRGELAYFTEHLRYATVGGRRS